MRVNGGEKAIRFAKKTNPKMSEAWLEFLRMRKLLKSEKIKDESVKERVEKRKKRMLKRTKMNLGK
jgi:hypothetical protein